MARDASSRYGFAMRSALASEGAPRSSMLAGLWCCRGRRGRAGAERAIIPNFDLGQSAVLKVNGSL